MGVIQETLRYAVDPPLGGLIVVAQGGEDAVQQAVDYLRAHQVGVEVLRHA